MEAIKKKMISMKIEKENANDIAEQLEQELKEKELEKMKKDEEMMEMQKKLQTIQFDCEMAEAALKEALGNLESSEKRAIEAEAEVQSLTKSVRLQEDNIEQTETRLQEAIIKLNEAIAAADESERTRRVLETRMIADIERICQLEDQLKEAKFIAEEADSKYDEAARKLAITEVDLDRSEHRLEAEDYKIVTLEEELMVVGNNMKSLEIMEQEAVMKEELYEESLRDLSDKLRMADQRATDAEQLVGKLQIEVDNLEDDLMAQKEKYKYLTAELDSAFAELTEY